MAGRLSSGSSTLHPSRFSVNGRTYKFPPQPVVVVCIDGSAPEYHERAIAVGRMPYLESLLHSGTILTGDCVMPSYTNPNNVSIATGVPPAAHGICGNYFFDRQTRTEVMMNDPEFLQVPTIFAAFEEAGGSVAVVTAKDKLRRLLGRGLERGICFSAEKADSATVQTHGISGVLDLVGKPLPSVYSGALSEFVMAAGVKLLEVRRPGIMYLTLSDYIQHKFAPDTWEAIDFYGMLDDYFAQLDALGAVLVVTSDHGMNAKSSPDGRPRVIYLQDQLDGWIGAGRSRVVLPITDPYTLHHGALGSFAFVYADDDVDIRTLGGRLAALSGVAEVVPHEEACRRFQLPSDRIGDLAVVGRQDVALGSSVGRHDLAQLERPLRSHGGLSEQRVPVFVNRPIAELPHGHRLRNFDAYWIGLNLTVKTLEDAGIS